MHWEAMQKMNSILDDLKLDFANVLDVGSMDVNGSYRGSVEKRGWAYTGLDISKGPNVDVISVDPYGFPVDNNMYDLVMSGSTMEHVEDIWLWVPELVRVLKPNGYLVILTHTSWEYHPHPVDCWRIMPDGMRFLFDLTEKLIDYDISMFNIRDISAVARKMDDGA